MGGSIGGASHDYRTCSRWEKTQKNIDERAVNFPPRLESCLNARIVQKDAHKTATFGFLLPPGFTRFNSTLTLLFFFYTPSFQESCSQSSIARRLPLGAFLHAAQIYGLPTAFPLISVVEQAGICTCVCYVEDREHCVPGTSEGVKQAITRGEGRGGGIWGEDVHKRSHVVVASCDPVKARFVGGFVVRY